MGVSRSVPALTLTLALALQFLWPVTASAETTQFLRTRQIAETLIGRTWDVVDDDSEWQLTLTEGGMALVVEDGECQALPFSISRNQFCTFMGYCFRISVQSGARLRQVILWRSDASEAGMLFLTPAKKVKTCER